MTSRLEIAARLCLSLVPFTFGMMTASTSGAEEQAVAVRGIATITVMADGDDVHVELAASAASLVGFEHPPETSGEWDTLRLATENLRTGDGLIRFNTGARCRLAKAEVDTGLERRDPDGHAVMSASYRFVCAQPEKLDSAAVGIFVGFPALERVLVHYALPNRRGGAELTRSRPVVTFVPLE
ncbi:MAG: DUF2796 domain-containing protein [Chromatiaceae bacterium]